MKTRVLFCSVVAVVAWAMLASGDDPAATKLKGSEPYSPTKLEWIAMHFNALRAKDTEEFSMNFGVDHATDSIRIIVVHSRDVDRRAMNAEIHTCREMIGIYLKTKGWDEWCRIKEVIVPSP